MMQVQAVVSQVAPTLKRRSLLSASTTPVATLAILHLTQAALGHIDTILAESAAI